MSVPSHSPITHTINPLLTLPATQQILPTSGFITASPNNAIVTFVSNNVDQGSGVDLTTFGLMTAAPGTKSFDLQSFFFGCIVPAFQTAVNVPAPCSVNVIGYLTSGAEIPVAKFTYTTQQAATHKMQKVDLVSWASGSAGRTAFTGLQSVRFELTADSLNTVVEGIAGVLLVDNVCKVVHT